MSKTPYQCPKCGNATCETGEMRTEGGWFSAWFDVSTRRFSFVACTRCGYTDLYKVPLGKLGQVVDFLIT